MGTVVGFYNDWCTKSPVICPDRNTFLFSNLTNNSKMIKPEAERLLTKAAKYTGKPMTGI